MLNTKVSQGSVATRLMGDGILNDKLITPESNGERILKIGQHLSCLYVPVLRHPVYIMTCDVLFAASTLSLARLRCRQLRKRNGLFF